MGPARGDRAALVAARRALPARDGLTPLAEIGLDGPWVSPYQLSCGAPRGPVLVSYNFLDAPTARAERVRLEADGYLPEMLFNRVLDAALDEARLERGEIYLTHSCHLLPPGRSARLPRSAIDDSMEAVTRPEIADRPVIALGREAAAACARFGIRHRQVAHPSARGLTASAKAAAIARALTAALADA